MATVIASIGSNSSIDTETPSSCSGSYATYNVTFSTSPSGVSVGDKAEITDENMFWGTFVYRVTAISGGTYTLAYVSDDVGAGDTSPCDLMDSFYSQAPATFKRFYSSITSWESNLDDSDVYSSGDIAIGECHNDSVFVETVNINGGGTVGLASIKLSVHSDSRHDGTAGTGARMVPTTGTAGIVTISRDEVTVEWLEIDGTSAGATSNMGVRVMSTATDDIYVRNLIIHDIGSTSGSHTSGVYLENVGTSRYVMNNFVYDISRTSSTSVHGISASYSGSGADIYCNTVFDISTTNGSAMGIRVGGSSALVKDNIVLSVSGTTLSDCYYTTGTASTSSDYNLSDDTTAWGSNSVTSSDGVTAANTIVSTTGSSEDLHLKSGSYALAAGVDLGTTPDGVEIDIDGRDRDALGDVWDIGADQAVGLSVTITPAASIFELSAITPNLAFSSLSMTPAAAAFEYAAASPGVVSGSLTISAVAEFELAAVNPTIPAIPIVVTPSVAAFEYVADSPSVLLGSVSVTPVASAVEYAAISPDVVSGSLAITPTASSFVLDAISPSLIVPLVITPSAAAMELVGQSPISINGSISITPTASSVELDAVAPGVVSGSLAMTPGVSAFEVAGISPAVEMGSMSITPAAASFELAASSSGVATGSVIASPAAATVSMPASYAGVISGSITVIPVASAPFNLDALTPSLTFSSMTVDVSASAVDVVGVTPTTHQGSIILAPSVAIVECIATLATIHAGVEVRPTAASFDYVAGPFTFHITMDSASLGYSIGGPADYAGWLPVEYAMANATDYVAGTWPTDYNIQQPTDYKYDHQS